jgi:hypothetical protein
MRAQPAGRVAASGFVEWIPRPSTARRTVCFQEHTLYFTDRGIEELEDRRGEEEVSLAWLAEQLRTFIDLNPDFEVPVERLATWLARLDDEDDEDDD